MRDKLFIAGSIFVIIVLVAVAALMFLFGDKKDETGTAANPFPSTSEEMPQGQVATPDPLEQIPDGWQAPAGATGQSVPMMRLISKEPALGPVAYTSSSTSDQPYVRYTVRNGGYAYETPLTRVEEPRKLTDREILRTGNVRWSAEANAVVMQYTNEMHDQVYSFLGYFGAAASTAPQPQNTPPSSFAGRPLPSNVLSAAVSPKGDSIFYLVAERSGSKGYIESVSSGNRIEAWSSPFKNLTVDWPAPHSVVIYNNPSIEAPGAVWVVDTKSLASEVVLGGEFALAARMNHVGTHIFYSVLDVNSSVYSLRSLDIKTGAVSYLAMPTLTEKCVWGQKVSTTVYCAVPRNMNVKDYLLEWQYGTLLSDDVLWLFDVVTGSSKRILDPVEYTKTTLDIVDMSIDQTDSYLVFRTKDKDMVWAVQLPATTPQQ